MTIATLRQRSDFIKARKGRRVNTPAFLIQVSPNGQDFVRVGLTVTKQLGNAVVRNRVKRRLRALVRDVMPESAVAGHDYVLIARAPALTYAYSRLLDDLRRALVDRAHSPNGR